MMKYKVATPEDYKDIEGYSYKVIHAYSQVYNDLLMVLTKIDTVADVMDDFNKDPISLEYLRKITGKFK